MIDKAKWKHEQALLKQAEYESVFCQLLERKLLSRFQTIAATVVLNFFSNLFYLDCKVSYGWYRCIYLRCC